MGEVIELNDPFIYIFDDKTKKVLAVQWSKPPNSLIIENCGRVDALLRTDCIIPPHELRQLMVMWLGVNNPDCLKFDEIEKENKIISWIQQID